MRKPALFGLSYVSISTCLLVLTGLLGARGQECSIVDGKYSTAVGDPCTVDLDEGKEVKFIFSGEPALKLGVSILQCTGEKPQELYAEFKRGTEFISNQAPRPGCLMLIRPDEELSECCVSPEYRWAEIRSEILEWDEDEDGEVLEGELIYPEDTRLILANEGNASTTVHIVMFTAVNPAPTSQLVLYDEDEAVPTAEINGLEVSLSVLLGWTPSSFCESHNCIVTAYVNEWTVDLPVVYICLAESQGDVVYADQLRRGEYEIEAKIELPNNFPNVLTVVLSHNATPNSTSPLLSVNEEIVYQALVEDGELYDYPSGALRVHDAPAITTLVALVLGVAGLSLWTS